MMYTTSANKWLTSPAGSHLSFLCAGIFICLNLFRFLADGLILAGVPFLVVYTLSIIIHNFIPIGIIFWACRRISPPVSFLSVFLITGPGVMAMDFMFFAHDPLDLLMTPAYYTQQGIFAVLLGIIAAAVSIYDTRRRLSIAIILLALVALLLTIQTAFLPFLA